MTEDLVIQLNLKNKTKICHTCGKYFSYTISRGADRKHCSVKCRRRYQLELREKRFLTLPKCKTKGCDNRATRVGDGLCESCYYRLRRTGSTKKRKYNYRYLTKEGYIKLKKPEHPLAMARGMVFEHRAVVYDFYNGKPQACYWCGKKIGWDDVVIDHLNENKIDNKIENLIYSCNDCNRARGAMLPFVKKMKTNSFKIFIEEMQRQRKV